MEQRMDSDTIEKLIAKLPGIDHVYIEIEGIVPGDDESYPSSYHIEGSGKTIAEAIEDAMEPHDDD